MNKNNFTVTRFSKVHLAAFALIFAALGGFLIWRSFALGPAVAKVEAEAMTLPAGSSVIEDASASGGRAVLLTVNGSLSSVVTTTTAVAHLEIIAKSNTCKGSSATIQVEVDNAAIGGPRTVSSSSYQKIGVDLVPPVVGTYTITITITYSNNLTKSKGKPCDRRLTVDAVTLYGAPTAPLLPTVTLSADPVTVNAGQSSNLSWASTNATSCTASGGWSGSRALSGSAATGQLTQTTTYTLSCSGLGGTAAASTTVTVQPPPVSPYVYINPQSLSSSAGSTFTVEVREDSLITAVNAVQANLSYPADKLELVNVDAAASAFTVEAQSVSTPGAIKLGRGYIGSLTGDKLVAKLTFMAKPGVSGLAEVSFEQGTYLVSATTNQDVLGSLANTRPLRLQIN